jgi:predicted nucleic acid-binding protein
LALAFAGQAELLVTGDRALLELDSRCPFKIISPARARELIGE